MPEQDPNSAETIAATTTPEASSVEAPQAEDVLVEEVSIDGMCGVY